MVNWRNRLVEYGTYLIVFIIPLLYFGGKFFTPYVTSKTFVFYGAVEIIFALWLYQTIFYRQFYFSRKLLLFFSPIFAFILWLTVAGVAGVRPEMSFWSSLGRGTGLLTLYHCMAFSITVVSLIKTNSFVYVRRLLLWFLNGSFILVLSIWFGNEGFSLPFEFLQKSKGGGLIGNSSLTAAYLLFSIFFSLFFLFSKEITRRSKIWVSIILLIIISSPLFINVYGLVTKGILQVSARGATLGIIIGILVSMICYFTLSNKKIVKYLGVISLSIISVIFVWGWISLMTHGSIVHEKFTESATDSRFIFWNIAQQGIKERPILGWGMENYSVVYQKYFNPDILKQSSTTAEVWVDRAHNIFYELGVSGGYMAIILYLILLVWLVTIICRAFKVGNITRLQAGILWGLIIGYVFQNLFVFDSICSYVIFFVLVSIIIGLGEKKDVEISNKKGGTFINKENNIPVMIIFFVPLLASLFFFMIMPLNKTVKISEVFTANLDKRFEYYKDLLNISPVGDGLEIGKLAEDSYNLYAGNLEKVRSDQKLLYYSQKDMEALLSYLKVVSEKEKFDFRLYLNMLRLSNLYAKLYSKDDPELMSDISKLGNHARSLSPNYFNLIYLPKH